MRSKVISCLLLGMLSTGLTAKEHKVLRDLRPDGKRTATGCLLEHQGSFIFTTQDGEQLDAIGSDKLDKHRNHTVKITGYTSGEDGKNWFHVQKIKHVSSSCSK